MAATLLERRATPIPAAATDDSRWRTLYRVGGAAALTSAVFLPIQVAVFIAWPPPSTVLGWFRLFQDNRIIGLVDMDLLLVADNVLLVAVLLALYAALRRVSPSVMAIATTLGLLGIALFIASNPAFELLSLSDRYAAAATDAERSGFLAAGQAVLAAWQGTSFQVAYLLGSAVGIVIGVVMLQGGSFGKPTAYAAILANAVGLGLYVPAVGVYIAVFSVLFLEVWYVLVARRLFQLGRGSPPAPEAALTHSQGGGTA
jgi:hypothetical protein